ncbi:MAG: prolyl oligopeptidase family serine peptidase [Planctomycetota bacterium]
MHSGTFAILLSFALLVTACGQSTPPVSNGAQSTNGSVAQTDDLPSRAKLPEQRGDYRTKIIRMTEVTDEAPDDPSGSPFRLVRYDSEVGKLAAYITRDPGDGEKHPAVIWAKGGFGGIGNWLWERMPKENDQSAMAFIDSGLVVMCPSWRAENDNPGKFEMFYGEVDDLMAALKYLKALPWVDANRIYLAGHSTGGTMALLGACATDDFRAVFSFGGCPDLKLVVGDGEGWGNTPFSYRNEDEVRLRSPLTFVGAITTPTFYFEGEESPYIADSQLMEQQAKKVDAPFHAYAIKGGTHFNILHDLMRMVAKKITLDTGETCNIEFSSSEVALEFEE